MTSLKHWPNTERPRERLLKLGAASLSDAELLAIILRIGSKGQSVMALAQALLLEFGSLSQLLKASPAELTRHKGLGLSKYAQLQALREITRRQHTPDLTPGVMLNTPLAAVDYFSNRFKDLPYEVFAMVYVDCKLKVLQHEILFSGSLNETAVYPREIIRRTLFHNAHAVILAHNHPSGDPTPSEQDLSLTRAIQSALKCIEVLVLDHLIIAHDLHYSFAQHGQL